MLHFRLCLTVLFAALLMTASSTHAQYGASARYLKKGSKDAPGAPGKAAFWQRPDKTAVGTTLSTPLWFTAYEGGVTEIFYPYVDRPQTEESFLLIRDQNRSWDERSFKTSTTRVPGSMVYHIKSQAPIGTINKVVQVSTFLHSVTIDYAIDFNGAAPRELIFIHNPAAQMTPGGDTIEVEKDSDGHPFLIAYQIDIRGDEPVSMQPRAYQMSSWTLSPSSAAVGFEGVNSPYDKDFDPNKGYERARYGNVAGGLIHQTNAQQVRFRVVLSFSVQKDWKADLYRQMTTLLGANLDSMIRQQQRQYSSYLSRLTYNRSDKLMESSILVLKGLEDKINKGALVAAPGNPAIPWHSHAPEHDYENSRRRIGDSNGGYHRVWPRDLYHKALAFLSVGEAETPIHIARWFRKVQLRSERPGSWAQNMWVDGTPSWGAFQVDQTAFPIVLVSRLVELKLVGYEEFRDMVVRAAEFLMIAGPHTDQERWEENRGGSPNSIGAAVQGLIAASWLESLAGDQSKSQRYLAKAKEWTDNLKNWTLVRNGAFGQNYFLRIENGPFGTWNPNEHRQILIQNKAPGQPNTFREDQIMDGGFLEWILAGIVNPKDPDFSNTIRIYDQYIRKSTYAGRGYIRYNEDAYGEKHVGGAWPLLSAERAIAALERGEDFREHLALIQRMATPAGLIAEQDTLSVRPLGWSHAAYMILQRSIQDKRSYYIPRRLIR